uniref:Uncharacterized protein n=1 Tax=Solanum tuberosum TaxID=4113 RepID=M1DIL2_SOLTU
MQASGVAGGTDGDHPRTVGGPTVRSDGPSDHGPWSRVVGQIPNFQPPVANDSRQARTVGPSTVRRSGMWIKEQSKDTRRKGTKQAEEVEKDEPGDRQVALQSA